MGLQSVGHNWVTKHIAHLSLTSWQRQLEREACGFLLVSECLHSITQEWSSLAQLDITFLYHFEGIVPLLSSFRHFGWEVQSLLILSHGYMVCFFFLGIYRILSLMFQNVVLWCLSEDELFWVPSGGGGGLVAKLCPTLCSPMVCSPPGSSDCGIFWQEHWSGLPCPAPGTFATQGSDSCLLHWQVDSFPLSHQGSPKTKMGLANWGPTLQSN